MFSDKIVLNYISNTFTMFYDSYVYFGAWKMRAYNIAIFKDTARGFVLLFPVL